MSSEQKQKFQLSDLPFYFLLWSLAIVFGGGILYVIYSLIFN